MIPAAQGEGHGWIKLAPARRRFGTLLIEQAFAAQVGGSALLEYTADGVICTLECQHL